VRATASVELAIDCRRVGYRHVIALTGRLDAERIGALRQAFWDAVECGAQEIWLDLSRLSRIDSAGVRAVSAIGVAAHELDRAVVLVGSRGVVASALAEQMIAEELPMFPTLSAAHYKHSVADG
jgi:anti-anti-sigma regulatory factor